MLTAENVRTYTVEKIRPPVSMSACPQKEPWRDLNSVQIDDFPWYSCGKKQDTHAWACYDSEALHLLFDCEDQHISALPRRTNGPVSLDSCVEFFASLPDDPRYFNLEINCCGDVHLGYGPGRTGRELCDPELVNEISVHTTVQDRPKTEAPQDDGWQLQTRLPFTVLRKLTGQPVRPKPGTRWDANFYRCGGRTDPQHACWSHIKAPSPDFHRPSFFGRVIFSD